MHYLKANKKLLIPILSISLCCLYINTSLAYSNCINSKSTSDIYIDENGNHCITVDKNTLNNIFPITRFTVVTIKCSEDEKELVLIQLKELAISNGYEVDEFGNMYTGKLIWTEVKFDIYESTINTENNSIIVNSPINKGGNIADISYIQVYWNEDSSSNTTNSVFNMENIKGNSNHNELHLHKGLSSHKIESPKASNVYFIADDKIKISIDSTNKSALIESLDPSIDIMKIHIKGGNSFNCYYKDSSNTDINLDLDSNNNTSNKENISCDSNKKFKKKNKKYINFNYKEHFISKSKNIF